MKIIEKLKVTTKGHITFPKIICEMLGLQTGAYVVFLDSDIDTITACASVRLAHTILMHQFVKSKARKPVLLVMHGLLAWFYLCWIIVRCTFLLLGEKNDKRFSITEITRGKEPPAMYLMFIVWILLGGLSLWLLFVSRMLLPHYPKPLQPKWWWMWDCTTFVLLALVALSVAILVFINLEPQARLLSAKEPLLLEGVNSENFHAENILGRVAGADIPRLINSGDFKTAANNVEQKIEKADLGIEEHVLKRLRTSVCTIEVSAEDVVPTGVYKNTDFGFFYVGGSTSSKRPGKGSPYFEAGFTEHYLATPLALLGPYTQYYQVTLSSGENIIALFDRYYYQQLQAKGQLTLPVGELSLLVIDNTARNLLQEKWLDTITSGTPLFIATEEAYSTANHIRLFAAWLTFGLVSFVLCQLKRFCNAKLFHLTGGRFYGFWQFFKECRQAVQE